MKTKFLLRIDERILAAVRTMAQVERRNVTEQINHMLEKSIPKDLLDETRADISSALVGGER